MTISNYRSLEVKAIRQYYEKPVTQDSTSKKGVLFSSMQQPSNRKSFEPVLTSDSKQNYRKVDYHA